ncbi:hypothetical protein FB45DRAFT_1017854 [Roridomyces roridus]|uniref:MYND-type domain-containing protein n=1 Tax=Roridomyces roridus TaxID=1738132 RepID=A0AAD7CJE1_9AGAR|nr:hypothetical protein FB45DRAFT_1017854 [Roridomyces roridus]
MQISEPHPEIITERAVRTLASCSVFIQGLAPNQPENLLELVEGAGGTIDDLAVCVHRALAVFGRAFWKLAPEERQDLLGPHLSAVYRFILDVNSQHLGSGYAPFFRRLLWEGFTLSLVPSVDRLVQVYVQVCQMPAHSEALEPLSLCLDLISHVWREPRSGFDGHTVRLRVLRALMDCLNMLDVVPVEVNNQVACAGIARRVKDMLGFLIPSHLVWFKMVRELQLPQNHDDLQTLNFSGSEYRTLWAALKGEIEQKLRLLYSEFYWRACDNLQCARIRARNEFRKCGTCQEAYYCPESECQKADWKADGHPHAKICSAPVSNPLLPALGCRERIFLRLIVDDDFQNNMNEIVRIQLSFLSENPTTGTIVTVFDYSHWPRQIWVCSALDPAVFPAFSLSDEKRDAAILRVEYSDGAMDLHVLRLPDAETLSEKPRQERLPGVGAQWLLMPLRMHRGSTFYADRNSLAQEHSRGSDMTSFNTGEICNELRTRGRTCH